MSTAEERMQNEIDELEQENRLLRARNERLEREGEMRRLALLDIMQAEPVQEPHPDDLAVDRFAESMKAKMAKQRAKGYGGWDDHEQCPTERLQAMLVDHLAKGDPVDVGNFAMMLWNRGESTAAPVQEPPDDELTQALIERDEAENTADELAQAIAQITGEDIGEHTSANFPWRNALDAAENWLCHPPAAQRQWVGLTPEEIDTVYRDMPPPVQHWQLARAIEAKLKEKNS